MVAPFIIAIIIVVVAAVRVPVQQVGLEVVRDIMCWRRRSVVVVHWCRVVGSSSPAAAARVGCGAIVDQKDAVGADRHEKGLDHAVEAIAQSSARDSVAAIRERFYYCRGGGGGGGDCSSFRVRWRLLLL